MLAVAGPGGSLQSGSLQSGALTAVADCAALALAARPAASVLTGAGASDSGLILAEALVALASAKTAIRWSSLPSMWPPTATAPGAGSSACRPAPGASKSWAGGASTVSD